MALAEKLRLIGENMTRVYEAGIKLGTETSGLLNVSLLNLNAEGNVVAHTGTIEDVTDKSVLVGANAAEVDIFISGYVEFSLHLTASAYAVVIDGKEHHANAVDEPFKAEDTVHFAGKVFDKIRISGYGFEDITFEYFVKGAIAIEEIFNNGQLAGEEAGKQAEYNAFWDTYIGKDGDIIAAVSMFSGYRWTDDIYKPTHTIKANAFSSMYQNASLTDTKVTLDLSYSNGTDVFRNASKLKYIRNIIIDDGNSFKNWFYGCTALEEIRFEGVIANSLDIHWSTKLSFESLASIVGALSKTVSGQSITLPATARQTYDNATFSGRWDELVAEYPNWSFKYS